jgi:hypothetical protein
LSDANAERAAADAAQETAMRVVLSHDHVAPRPAQMICLGYHGDADNDGIRDWWWVHGPYPDFFDDFDSVVARCQDAAKIDLGWFRPPLRLVQSERGEAAS